MRVFTQITYNHYNPLILKESLLISNFLGHLESINSFISYYVRLELPDAKYIHSFLFDCETQFKFGSTVNQGPMAQTKNVIDNLK